MIAIEAAQCCMWLLELLHIIWINQKTQTEKLIFSYATGNSQVCIKQLQVLQVPASCQLFITVCLHYLVGMFVKIIRLAVCTNFAIGKRHCKLSPQWLHLHLQTGSRTRLLKKYFKGL